MTNPPVSVRLHALMAVLATVALAAGCNSETGKSAILPPGTSPASAASISPKPSNPMEIATSPNLVEHIRIGESTWAHVGADVTVTARIEVDETRVTRIGSPVMGRIVEVQVREGQDVQRGQLLALVYSAGLSDAQLAFLRALSQRHVAQRAVERAQILLKAEVIGTAELQRREAELAQASAELDVGRDQLALLGMHAEAVTHLEKTRTLNSMSHVIASMAGTVLDRKVTLGQVVQPADTMYEIAELSHVWLVADVPERQAGHLAVGQEVKAEVAAFAGRMIQGRLSYVSPTVNRETHTVQVRVDLPNPERRLKPAMLATMVVTEPAERRQVIPVLAVVREGNRDYVFIQRDPETYVLRPVTLGGEHDGSREVLAGIEPGEKLIVDGAFHLNNERRRRTQRGGEGA